VHVLVSVSNEHLADILGDTKANQTSHHGMSKRVQGLPA
jgi:hypothetical protein